jgi:hypothetical protein
LESETSRIGDRITAKDTMIFGQLQIKNITPYINKQYNTTSDIKNKQIQQSTLTKKYNTVSKRTNKYNTIHKQIHTTL